MLFNRTDEGLESLGPPQRILLDANWKTAGEQSGVDGFHTLMLHRSLMEVGQFGRNADDIYANAPALYGIDIGTEQVPGFRCIAPVNTFGTLMGDRKSTRPHSSHDCADQMPSYTSKHQHQLYTI